MILDIAPGAAISVDGIRYVVNEHSSFHDVDFRLDLVQLIGPTPAHERWLLTVMAEPYLMFLQRFEHCWLRQPETSFQHEGERFVNIYRGSANRVKRTRHNKSKEGRVGYALFRADSGRIILAVGTDVDADTFVGVTLPVNAITLPEKTKGK